MSISSQSQSFDSCGQILDALVDGFTALVKQVLDLPLQQRKADIYHDRQADDFGRSLKIMEWISHPRTLRDVLSALKNFCSDNAVGMGSRNRRNAQLHSYNED